MLKQALSSERDRTSTSSQKALGTFGTLSESVDQFHILDSAPTSTLASICTPSSTRSDLIWPVIHFCLQHTCSYVRPSLLEFVLTIVYVKRSWLIILLIQNLSQKVLSSMVRKNVPSRYC